MMLKKSRNFNRWKAKAFTTKQSLLRVTLGLNSGEADSAYLFFDVTIFHPHANSSPKTLSDAYKYHESAKPIKDQQRILDVDLSSFVLPIFACTGGAAPGSTKGAQKLANKISEKRNESYSDTKKL